MLKLGQHRVIAVGQRRRHVWGSVDRLLPGSDLVNEPLQQLVRGGRCSRGAAWGLQGWLLCSASCEHTMPGSTHGDTLTVCRSSSRGRLVGVTRGGGAADALDGPGSPWGVYHAASRSRWGTDVC